MIILIIYKFIENYIYKLIHSNIKKIFLDNFLIT